MTIKEKVDFQLKLVECMKSSYNGLLWQTVLTGKMDGFCSISTSPTCNKYCQLYRLDPDKICSKCYSCAAMEYRKSFLEKLIQNSLLLQERILDYTELPIIFLPFYRFESHGDAANEIQVINYFNICEKNPNTTFSVWTKNPNLYKNAIEAGHDKPKNLIIVLSSHYLNVVADPSKYDFIDIVFTVFTASYAIENNIVINCGGQKCINCLRCYTRHNGVIYINEMLKQEQKKYYKLLQLKKNQ